MSAERYRSDCRASRRLAAPSAAPSLAPAWPIQPGQPPVVAAFVRGLMRDHAGPYERGTRLVHGPHPEPAPAVQPLVRQQASLGTRYSCTPFREHEPAA